MSTSIALVGGSGFIGSHLADTLVRRGFEVRILDLVPSTAFPMLYRSLDVRDGLSKTLAIGERAAMFAKSPWAGVMTGGTVRTTPGAPVYTAIVELSPAMVMARMGNRSLNSPLSEPYDFFSSHGEVVFFAFADSSVQGLTSGVDPDVLHALATRSQRDVVAGGF